MAVTITGTGDISVSGAIQAAGGFIGTALSATNIADSSVTRSKIGYAGAILQIKQIIWDQAFYDITGATGWQDVPSFGTSINISKVTNKVLIHYSLVISPRAGAYGGQIALCRNGQFIEGALGETSTGNVVRGVACTSDVFQGYYGYSSWEANKIFIDSPNTTGNVTYNMKYRDPYGSTGALCFNRHYQGGGTNVGGPISELTLMEISG